MNMEYGTFIPLYDRVESKSLKWYEKLFDFICGIKLLIASLLLNVLFWILIIFLMKHNYHYAVEWISPLSIPLGLLLGVSIGDAIWE